MALLLGLYSKACFLVFQQVRAQPLGALVALFNFPVFYLGLVSAQQYVRHFPSFIVAGLVYMGADSRSS